MKKLYLLLIASLVIVLSAQAADNNRVGGYSTVDDKKWCVCVQGKDCPCEGYEESRKDDRKFITPTKKKKKGPTRGRGAGIMRFGPRHSFPEEIKENSSKLPYEYACGSNSDGSTMMCPNW